MSILLTAHDLKKSFGSRALFDQLNFTIESQERIGLIGPNGAGKSTLLRILSGKMEPDEGNLTRQRGLKVGFLEQVPEFKKDATVHSTVLEGVEDIHDWQCLANADEFLSKLSLDGSQGISPETPIAQLSGGWKKRAALARELVSSPDLLLLDEPTNHLDVESILWLEEFLAKATCATMTITHDRLFLQRIANRILELDRRNPQGILSVRGDYADYLEQKAENMANQVQRETTLKNTLRRETEWLRRGAKARSTKQQARIQRAGDLKSEVEELGSRNQTRTVQIDFQSEDRQPKKLIEAKHISKSYDGQKIFEDVSLLVTPKSRLGLLGANGCGKSTLLRVLLGKEAPDSGELFRSDQLSVAYFEQNRETLDPKISLAKTLSPTGDHVIYRGNPVHVRGYLDRFLFSGPQMEMAVGQLSGGEQSRLLIARLMLQAANVLVLDEPTNDLDMATLDILEDCLRDFNGAVLLVTHDRYFLDQIATQIIAFPPGSSKLESFADLDQWENWHRERGKAKKSAPLPDKKTEVASAPEKKRKLSFKEQRELDGMEGIILENEAELARLHEALQLPENLSNAQRLLELNQKINDLQAKIDQSYARWTELGELAKP